MAVSTDTYLPRCLATVNDEVVTIGGEVAAEEEEEAAGEEGTDNLPLLPDSSILLSSSATTVTVGAEGSLGGGDNCDCCCELARISMSRLAMVGGSFFKKDSLLASGSLDSASSPTPAPLINRLLILSCSASFLPFSSRSSSACTASSSTYDCCNARNGFTPLDTDAHHEDTTSELSTNVSLLSRLWLSCVLMARNSEILSTAKLLSTGRVFHNSVSSVPRRCSNDSL